MLNKVVFNFANNVSVDDISALAPMAATQWQAATSGVFLSRFHFGPLSKIHVSRDAYNTPSFPILPLLPPSCKREVRRGRRTTLIGITAPQSGPFTPCEPETIGV